ncbi:F-box only protein 16 isoform X5 [Lepisosteus oculatus]|uniref:F-box only protein 16 isoform X5 n=1 Tax=Lepisosteus oculatus TaxID=7918 RepID=UPI0035F51EBA
MVVIRKETFTLYRRRMAFAPTRHTNGLKMQTKMSTWTPLNHQLSNDKVFQERRDLLGKWFDKWTDSQRKQVLQDFFDKCSKVQLRFASKQLRNRIPEEALDFTTVLPRVLSLYVFSYLDPRSLCRCAQVSWHWKELTELDQLWMPKCLRLGWYINFTPTPFEQSVWKRHYIETVKELHISRPKTPTKDQFVVPEVKAISHEVPDLAVSCTKPVQTAPPSHKGGSTVRKELPPWRGSDRHPTDTLRFNYLENFDPIEQAHQAQRKGKGMTTNLFKRENRPKKTLSASTYKLRKAKSLMFLSLDMNASQRVQSRPNWATNKSEDYPVTKETAKRLAQTTEWNAGMYPRPVRAPIPQMSEKGLKASQRTQRSSPTVPLFEVQPWKIPPSDQGSDED